MRHGQHVRRHRRRRRAQRPRRRGLPGPGRPAHRGPRGPGDHRGRGHDRDAVARAPNVGHPAVLRHEPDAADDPRRPRARAARLQGAPDGALLPGLPRGRLATIHDDDPGRTTSEIAKCRRKDADAWASGTPGWPGWPTCSARCCSRCRPTVGSHRPADLADLARLAWRNRGLDVRTVADVTRLMTMSIADLLDDWFESPAGQGRAGRQRRHRHLGRPLRAGHGVRDGAPLDRRRRRRPARQLGLPRGRHGCGLGRHPARRPSRSAPRSAPTRRSSDAGRATAGSSGVVLADGEELRRPGRGGQPHPQITFLDHLGRAELPDDFVRDIERWRSRCGTVKVNVALVRLPDFTADPDRRPGSSTPGRSRWRHDGLHRAGLPGRPRGPAGAAPFSDGVIPTTLDRTLCPDGHPRHVAVHPVGARRSGRASRTPTSWRPTPTG